MNECIILHNIALHHLAERLEELLDFGGGDTFRNITHVDLGGIAYLSGSVLDGDAGAVDLVLVQSRDGFLRRLFLVHMHEAIVFQNVTVGHGAILLKQSTELVFCGC